MYENLNQEVSLQTLTVIYIIYVGISLAEKYCFQYVLVCVSSIAFNSNQFIHVIYISISLCKKYCLK